MKLKLLYSSFVLSTLMGTVQAGPQTSPAIISGISSNNIVTINASDAGKVRGEYFDTKAAADDFCRNHKDKCDARWYSYTKKKYGVKDRRRFRPDVNYSY